MTGRRDALTEPQPIPQGSAPILVDADARYVPGLLSALEGKKYSSSWEGGEPWSEGAQYYTRLQWSLLMDASSRIISEIRQVRGPKPGQDPSESYDPDVTPQYNGTQLFDVLYNDVSGLEGVNEKLQLLVENMTAEQREEQIAILRGILLVLGGTPV